MPSNQRVRHPSNNAAEAPPSRRGGIHGVSCGARPLSGPDAAGTRPRGPRVAAPKGREGGGSWAVFLAILEWFLAVFGRPKVLRPFSTSRRRWRRRTAPPRRGWPGPPAAPFKRRCYPLLFDPLNTLCRITSTCSRFWALYIKALQPFKPVEPPGTGINGSKSGCGLVSRHGQTSGHGTGTIGSNSVPCITNNT